MTKPTRKHSPKRNAIKTPIIPSININTLMNNPFKKEKERKQRLGLTLLVSLVVFGINTVAIITAALVVYIFLKLGLMDNIDGEFNLLNIAILMIVVSIILGFLITFFTGKFTLKPLNQIINKLNHLSEGDFQTRLHFGKPLCDHPSFFEIEDSFNRAAAELEHTEVLRSDFINNFSHEFKTPIVSIAGFASLLRHGNLSHEESMEYLKIIEEESMRLSYMATNILNLTKIENQTILTDLSSFNLSEQIRHALLLLADQWTSKGLSPDADFGEYEIIANEELLKEVWINLLDNAIKFADPDTTFSVSIQPGNHTLAIAISNHGPTIPEESLTRIFNKFYQADQSHATDGHGIGLAIVKKVVLLHQGDVMVESVQGHTCFTVILPTS